MYCMDTGELLWPATKRIFLLVTTRYVPPPEGACISICSMMHRTGTRVAMVTSNKFESFAGHHLE